MDFKIRKMRLEDKKEVISMMEEFYSSNAVYTNGSIEIFEADFLNATNDNPYLEGFVFCFESSILGYAMVSKSFSTEFGKICVWFEDLYLKPEFRGRHIIPEFMQYIEKTFKNAIFRLEVEKENTHGVYVYEKQGYIKLPYIEMKK